MLCKYLLIKLLARCEDLLESQRTNLLNSDDDFIPIITLESQRTNFLNSDVGETDDYIPKITTVVVQRKSERA